MADEGRLLCGDQVAALSKAIEYCAICPNMCRFDCPVARAERSESAAPAGKVRLAYMLARGMLTRSEELAAYLYRCADCRGCEVWCPFPEVKVADIMVAARADALAAGVMPQAALAVRDSLRRHGHPFATAVAGPLSPADALGRADGAADGSVRGGVLFLPGCTAAALRPAASRAMAAILTAAGVPWRTLSHLLCCGSPARAAGDLALEAELAARLAGAIAESGAEVVVTACPGCTEALTMRYPELGLAVGPRVVHFAAYAAELLAAGRLRPRPINLSSVVYHDPCTMARRLALTAEPRTVLAAIPGLSTREARAQGRETHCCGSGGLLGEVWPAAAAAISRERLGELADTGAAAIVTTCPMCEHTFSQQKTDLPVFDLAEVLIAAVAGGGADD